MILHSEVGKNRFEISRRLKILIDQGRIKLGGNTQLKIYGTLSCKSGKRMKLENRIFFNSEHEAVETGYRPCGHCMRQNYLEWKNNSFTL